MKYVKFLIITLTSKQKKVIYLCYILSSNQFNLGILNFTFINPKTKSKSTNQMEEIPSPSLWKIIRLQKIKIAQISWFILKSKLQTTPFFQGFLLYKNQTRMGFSLDELSHTPLQLFPPVFNEFMFLIDLYMFVYSISYVMLA